MEAVKGNGVYFAAVDIGGTKMTASVANRDGILARVYQPVRLEGDSKTVPGQVKLLAGRACELAGIGQDEIRSLGVSTCGPFKREEGRIALVAPNLCGGIASDRCLLTNDWSLIPLESELFRSFGKLVIENDAVAAAMAERLFGAGAGEDNMVYVTWSTGIGSGAYVDGRLIRGKNGNAPHLGHIYLVDDGPMCGCGNSGDMEALASGTAIGRDYGGGATAEDVFAAYRRGDSRAVEIVERAARYFARGLVSINAVLDTKVFVIGGSVFLNNVDILTSKIEEEFFRSFTALSGGVEFRASGLDSYLGDMAGLSLVMPDEWISEWQDGRQWEHAPGAVVLD